MDSRGGAGRSCAAPGPCPPGQPAGEARPVPREPAVPVAERPAEPARPTAQPVAWLAPPAAGREPERHAALEEVPRAVARRAAPVLRSARRWGPRSGAWRARAAAQARERGARALQEAPGVGERNRGPPERRVPAGLLRRRGGAPVPRRTRCPVPRAHRRDTQLTHT